VIQLKGSQPKRLKPGRDGRQTEWNDLLAAVVAHRPYNELDWAVDSTLTAVPGRNGNLLRQARHVGRGREVRSDFTPPTYRLGRHHTLQGEPGRHLSVYPMPGITKAV